MISEHFGETRKKFWSNAFQPKYYKSSMPDQLSDWQNFTVKDEKSLQRKIKSKNPVFLSYKIFKKSKKNWKLLTHQIAEGQFDFNSSDSKKIYTRLKYAKKFINDILGKIKYKGHHVSKINDDLEKSITNLDLSFEEENDIIVKKVNFKEIQPVVINTEKEITETIINDKFEKVVSEHFEEKSETSKKVIITTTTITDRRQSQFSHFDYSELRDLRRENFRLLCPHSDKYASFICVHPESNILYGGKEEFSKLQEKYQKYCYFFEDMIGKDYFIYLRDKLQSFHDHKGSITDQISIHIDIIKEKLIDNLEAMKIRLFSYLQKNIEDKNILSIDNFQKLHKKVFCSTPTNDELKIYSYLLYVLLQAGFEKDSYLFDFPKFKELLTQIEAQNSFFMNEFLSKFIMVPKFHYPRLLINLNLEQNLIPHFFIKNHFLLLTDELGHIFIHDFIENNTRFIIDAKKPVTSLDYDFENEILAVSCIFSQKTSLFKVTLNEVTFLKSQSKPYNGFHIYEVKFLNAQTIISFDNKGVIRIWSVQDLKDITILETNGNFCFSKVSFKNYHEFDNLAHVILGTKCGQFCYYKVKINYDIQEVCRQKVEQFEITGVEFFYKNDLFIIGNNKGTLKLVNNKGNIIWTKTNFSSLPLYNMKAFINQGILSFHNKCNCIHFVDSENSSEIMKIEICERIEMSVYDERKNFLIVKTKKGGLLIYVFVDRDVDLGQFKKNLFFNEFDPYFYQKSNNNITGLNN